MQEHFHEHPHDHSHDHGAPVSEEERLALLQYMLKHNAHHAEELHDLAHGTEGKARELLHAAVGDIEESNKKIEEALALLRGE